MKTICGVSFLLLCGFIAITANGSSNYYPYGSNTAPEPQTCRLLKTYLKLNVKKLAGVWYTYAGYPSAFAPGSCKYIRAIPINKNKLLFNVVNFDPDASSTSPNLKAVIKIKRTQQLQPIITKVVYPNNIKITNWRILKVDYKNYAILNACVYQNGVYAGRLLWILTRKHELPSKHWQDVLKGMHEFKVPTAPLQQINQANCINVTLSNTSLDDLSNLSQISSSSST